VRALVRKKELNGEFTKSVAFFMISFFNMKVVWLIYLIILSSAAMTQKHVVKTFEYEGTSYKGIKSLFRFYYAVGSSKIV
jgi:hypothetical protein